MTETLNLPETETETTKLFHLELWLSRSKIVCQTHQSLQGDPDNDPIGGYSFVTLEGAALLPNLQSITLHGVWSAKQLSMLQGLIPKVQRLVFIHADNATVKHALQYAPALWSVKLEACITGGTTLRLPSYCFSYEEKQCKAPLLLTSGSNSLSRTYQDTRLDHDSWNGGDGPGRVWLTSCDTDIVPRWKKKPKTVRVAYVQGGSISERSIPHLNALGVTVSACKLVLDPDIPFAEKNHTVEHLVLRGDWPIGESQATDFLSRFACLKKLELNYIDLNRSMIAAINKMESLEVLTIDDCLNGVVLRHLTSSNLRTIRCEAKLRKFVVHLAKTAHIASDEEIEEAWDEFMVLGVDPDFSGFGCCGSFCITRSE